MMKINILGTPEAHTVLHLVKRVPFKGNLDECNTTVVFNENEPIHNAFTKHISSFIFPLKLL